MTCCHRRCWLGQETHSAGLPTCRCVHSHSSLSGQGGCKSCHDRANSRRDVSSQGSRARWPWGGGYQLPSFLPYLFISSELSRSSAPALRCSPRSPTRADPPGVSAGVLASRGVTAPGRPEAAVCGCCCCCHTVQWSHAVPGTSRQK
jgi:hypothetical protein